MVLWGGGGALQEGLREVAGRSLTSAITVTKSSFQGVLSEVPKTPSLPEKDPLSPVAPTVGAKSIRKILRQP